MSKSILFALALSVAAVSSAHAQMAPAAAPAPAAAAFSTDTPIETIVANAEGKATLDKLFPGLTSHPQYETFKGFSLKQLQPYSEGKITDDLLKTADVELAKIKG